MVIFVCNLQDENNLDKLKNSKEFKDLKDYIAKKNLFPVVVGYIKDYSKKAKLDEKDVISFAQELKESSQFRHAQYESYLYADNPLVALVDITREYLSLKFNKNFAFITTPEKDIKCTFIIYDEIEIKNTKKKHYCRFY